MYEPSVIMALNLGFGVIIGMVSYFSFGGGVLSRFIFTCLLPAPWLFWFMQYVTVERGYGGMITIYIVYMTISLVVGFAIGLCAHRTHNENNDVVFPGQ
jgi:hypothetical protein